MGATPLPDLVLYERDGCHLCEQTFELLAALLDERAARGLAVPAIVRRDIDSDPGWQRAYFETIPVLEWADRRMELAIGLGKIRGFLHGAADALTAEAPPL